MEKLTPSSIKMEDLPDELISKILDYVPLKDIFTSTQYASFRLRRLCQEYTLPTNIDLPKYDFLNTRELCRLIRSSDITQFHYNDIYRSFPISDRSICATLARYAKSLSRFSFTSCHRINGNALLSLLNSGNEIVELKVQSYDCDSLNRAVLQCTNLSELPFLRKLSLYGNYIGSEAIKKIVNASPHLIDVTFAIPSREELLAHTIQKRGAQLKHLNFNADRQYKFIRELGKCSQLETLAIRDLRFNVAELKLPCLPTLKNLILCRSSDRGDISYSLKSVPNLIELKLIDNEGINMQTARNIVALSDLRRVLIPQPLSKQVAFFLFSNCRSLKCTQTHVLSVSEMSDGEIAKCFARFHTLVLIRVNFNFKFMVKRYANLLPRTRVYISFSSGYNDLMRIWPKECIFHPLEQVFKGIA